MSALRLQPDRPWEPAVLRLGVAFALAYDACFLTLFGLSSILDRPSRLEELGRPIRVLGSVPALVGVLLVALVALFRFARRPGRLLEGGLALAATGLLMTFFQAYTSNTSRLMVFGGAVMLGWLAGLVWARLARETRRSESVAASSALAVFATTFVIAALAKIQASGWTWAHDSTLRSTILIHWDPDPSSWRRHLQDLFLTSVPGLGVLPAITLFMQATAFLMLVSRPLRYLYAGFFFIFQLVVFSVTPIPPQTVGLLALIFGWPGAWVARRLERRREDPTRSPAGPSTGAGGEDPDLAVASDPSWSSLARPAAALIVAAALVALMPWERCLGSPAPPSESPFTAGQSEGPYTVRDVTAPSGGRYSLYLARHEVSDEDSQRPSLIELLVRPRAEPPPVQCAGPTITSGPLALCLAHSSPLQDPDAAEAARRMLRQQ